MKIKKNHEINQNKNNEIYLLCFFKVSFNKYFFIKNNEKYKIINLEIINFEIITFSFLIIFFHENKKF